MNLLTQALQFLVGMVFDVLVTCLVARFYLNLVRASFHHPVAHFVTALTDFAVMPLRRLLPGWRRIDWASVLMALLFSVLEMLLTAWLSGVTFGRLPAVLHFFFGMAILHLLRLFIYLIMGAILLQAVLSWIQPYHGMSALLNSMTAPWLRRARRLIGPIGGLDLSPMLVLVFFQLILMLPLAWLGQLLLVA